MSKKPTVTTIASGFYSTSALNNNFTNIRDQFDNTLSLDGSTPNSMGADLDMNSNDILNANQIDTTSLYVSGNLLTTTTAALAPDANAVNYNQGGTGAVNRTVESRLQDSVSVKDFGAVGDGVADDTAAIQAAIDFNSVVYFPAGTYKVTCGSTTDFDYGNTTIPVHYALNIDKSNLTLIGDHAVIDVHGYDNPAGGEINYTMSTAKNMTAETLEDIWIEGLDFEFNPTGKVASTYRSMHIVGCKGVTIKNCRFYSSGSRYGATITLQNTNTVTLDGLTFDNTTQGMNFSYVSDVQMSNINFDNFNEAIDFDRVVRRVEANNIRFLGNGSGQCWDMNSCQDMKLSNISAKDSDNVILINFKSTTPLTYANYVNNDAVTAYTTSRNISINGLTMDNCGQGASSIYVGITFNTNLDDVIQDVFLSNVMAYQSGGVQVEGCRNFVLKDSVWNEGYGITTSGFGLLFLAKSAYANNELSLTLDNVKIKDVMNSCDAIRISAPSKAVLRDVWVENYPQDAVEISSPETHALISFEDCSFLRTIDTSVTGTAVRFASFSSEDVSVKWDNINITQYTTPVVVTGAGGAFPKKIIPVGNLDTTGSTAQVVTLYQHGEKSAYFTQVEYSCGITLAADATDYTGTSVRNTGTALCSGSTTGGMIAGAMVASNFATPEAEALIEPGEVMYFQGTKQGAGQVIQGFAVHAHYLEFLRV